MVAAGTASRRPACTPVAGGSGRARPVARSLRETRGDRGGDRTLHLGAVDDAEDRGDGRAWRGAREGPWRAGADRALGRSGRRGGPGRRRAPAPSGRSESDSSSSCATAGAAGRSRCSSRSASASGWWSSTVRETGPIGVPSVTTSDTCSSPWAARRAAWPAPPWPTTTRSLPSPAKRLQDHAPAARPAPRCRRRRRSRGGRRSRVPRATNQSPAAAAGGLTIVGVEAGRGRGPRGGRRGRRARRRWRRRRSRRAPWWSGPGPAGPPGRALRRAGRRRVRGAAPSRRARRRRAARCVRRSRPSGSPAPTGPPRPAGPRRGRAAPRRRRPRRPGRPRGGSGRGPAGPGSRRAGRRARP